LNEFLAEALERDRIRIEPGDVPGQFFLADFFKPVGKIVLSPLQPQPGFEDMKIDGINAHLPEDFAKFPQIPGFIGSGQDKRPAGHEMEFLAFLAVVVPSVLLTRVRFQYLEKFFPKSTDAPKLDGIDAGQAFSQPVQTQRVRHPESEVVGRFGRQIVMLLKKSMGVIIDGGSGNLSHPFEKFRSVLRLPSQKFDQVQPSIKAKSFLHDLTSTFSFR
jgi:hypothetical protein